MTHHRAAEYHKPEPRRKKSRPCLRCNKPFPSEGPFNRLCTDCRHAMAHAPTESTTYALAIPGRRTVRGDG